MRNQSPSLGTTTWGAKNAHDDGRTTNERNATAPVGGGGRFSSWNRNAALHSQTDEVETWNKGIWERLVRFENHKERVWANAEARQKGAALTLANVHATPNRSQPCTRSKDTGGALSPSSNTFMDIDSNTFDSIPGLAPASAPASADADAGTGGAPSGLCVEGSSVGLKLEKIPLAPSTPPGAQNGSSENKHRMGTNTSHGSSKNSNSNTRNGKAVVPRNTILQTNGRIIAAPASAPSGAFRGRPRRLWIDANRKDAQGANVPTPRWKHMQDEEYLAASTEKIRELIARKSAPLSVVMREFQGGRQAV